MRRLWISLAVVMIASFAALLGVGLHGLSQAPPIPDRVVTVDDAGRERLVFDGETIRRGQGVWQSLGGQEVGSVFGHGAYVAPDWTADWLHRELVLSLDARARMQSGVAYAQLDPDAQAALRQRLTRDYRGAAYDATRGRLVIDPARAAAFEALSAHYADVFERGRDEYAIPRGALADPGKQRELAAFFFWTSWAASTARPGADVTYTQNWPHEELVGNRPTGAALVWSVVSFVLLLAGVGGMVWWFASRPHEVEREPPPRRDPLLGYHPTPSQRATVKYFWTVAALWVVQVALGAIVAHYGVEGSGFYGIPLDRWLPYSIARTWHLQIGIFWIATSWLATGLYLVPAVAGAEPKGQRLGVNVLYGALLVLVVSARSPASGSASGRNSARSGSGSARRGTSTSTSAGSGRSCC
jgi:nitric oxide reductase subunit B